MSATLDSALYLAARGGRVFPLHSIRCDSAGRSVCTCGDPACTQPGKHPIGALVPNGVTNATTNLQTVERLFNRAPYANVGLATGRTVVLDVDPRHGGDASLEALEAQHGPLPETTRALTGGGGWHVLFRAPAGVEIRNSAGKLAPGLDVRGTGGYVVAPPSLHASGRRYEWSVDHHPDEVPPAEMPAWLVTVLAEPAGGGAARTTSDWRKLVAEGVPEGGRNPAVAALTGHLLRRYVDPVVVYELIHAWNATRCQPPLDAAEVDKVVLSITRREMKRQEARNDLHD